VEVEVEVLLPPGLGFGGFVTSAARLLLINILLLNKRLTSHKAAAKAIKCSTFTMMFLRKEKQ
jgi:hypothetical protein